MEIRIQKIPRNKHQILEAIARVKFGVSLSVHAKMLLNQNADRYPEEEIQRILSLHESIKK